MCRDCTKNMFKCTARFMCLPILRTKKETDEIRLRQGKENTV